MLKPFILQTIFKIPSTNSNCDLAKNPSKFYKIPIIQKIIDFKIKARLCIGGDEQSYLSNHRGFAYF